MKVSRTVKICGNHIKETVYENGFHSGYSLEQYYFIHEVDGKKQYYSKKDGSLRLVGRQSKANEPDKIINRKKVINRARNKLIELINTNELYWIDHKKKIYPKFLTLTFEENIEDVKEANKEFKNYIDKLNQYIRNNLIDDYLGVQYIAIPEIQEKRMEKYGNAVWHYHVLLFNMPYIDWKTLVSLWSRGGAYIEGINGRSTLNWDIKEKCFKDGKDPIKNVGAYIMKTLNYMVKDFDIEKDRLANSNSYLISKKLLKPRVLTDAKNEKEIKELAPLLSLGNVTYISEYENEYLGVCSTREYNTRTIKKQEEN